MVRQRGLGRVYWVGSAGIGRFDILIVERDGEWRLLLYVKDRHAQSRTFATEQEAIDAGTTLDTELRSRPWFTWELSGKDSRAALAELSIARDTMPRPSSTVTSMPAGSEPSCSRLPPGQSMVTSSAPLPEPTPNVIGNSDCDR